MARGYIDDQAIEDAKTVLGQEIRRDRCQWVHEATRDSLAHFVEGIGDLNPLFRDESYAKTTRWDTLIAQPCFLYAVDHTVLLLKLPGVHGIHVGGDWTWYDVVRLGDVVDSKMIFEDMSVKSGEFASRWVLQAGKVSYWRSSDGQLLATAIGNTARTPRGEALQKEGKTKYEAREPEPYAPEELAAIERQVLNEEIRGSMPRFAEDVLEGETLPAIVRGPLTSTDITAFYCGTLGTWGYGGAHGDRLRYWQLHPADHHISEVTGARDAAGRGHLEARTGVDVGMGGAYDLAAQRISWAASLLTNWTGDDGFLYKLSIQVRLPNLIGDTTWWNGEVVDKSVVEGNAAVHFEIVATDHRTGNVTAAGTATVLLPSRSSGSVRLPLSVGE